MITKIQAMNLYNNECKICKKNLKETPKQAHFHHLRSFSKKYNMSDLFNKASTEKTVKELSKCILLCDKCHCELHKELGKKVYKKQSLQYITTRAASL